VLPIVTLLTPGPPMMVVFWLPGSITVLSVPALASTVRFSMPE
jgi:hypothetical protein